MASSFGEVLHTRQIKFLIGPEETPIVVHAGAIARLSEPLDRLLNGSMREAQENVVRFRDLQVPDFERICEFSYRGVYTNPKPEQFLSTEVDEGTHSVRLADPLSYYPSVRQVYNFNASLSDGKEEADAAYDPVDNPVKNIFRPRFGVLSTSYNWPPEFFDNKSWKENFAPVFLGHARLYVFAEQYLIPELKKHALEHLRCTLREHTLFESGLKPVVQLARFAYDGDLIPGREGEVVDPLRQMVVVYIVMHLKHFRNHAGHRQLLENQNEYAADVIDIVSKWFDLRELEQREWLKVCNPGPDAQ